MNKGINNPNIGHDLIPYILAWWPIAQAMDKSIGALPLAVGFLSAIKFTPANTPNFTEPFARFGNLPLSAFSAPNR